MVCSSGVCVSCLCGVCGVSLCGVYVCGFLCVLFGVCMCVRVCVEGGERGGEGISTVPGMIYHRVTNFCVCVESRVE